MNTIFTIAAGNYLAQALTLGDSVKKHNPEAAFFIFIVGEKPTLRPEDDKYTVIEAKDLNIPTFNEMAFQYDVIELCTAIKPFCFDYLFASKTYKSIVYLDPDISVYSPLSNIFSLLENNFILLTPHVVRPEISYSGMADEGLLLFVGTYNLGFVALNNSERAAFLIEWWKERLKDKCYADKFDGLHVDQKWMEFIPSFYDDGYHIIRDMGHNVAFWNLHERQIVELSGTYAVKDRIEPVTHVPLVFFHFAAFDPYNPEVIHKNNKQFSRSSFPELTLIMKEYTAKLLDNNFAEYSRTPYGYASFLNGNPILKFQRRLYRRLKEEGVHFENPFVIGKGSFYQLLKRSGLLSKLATASTDKLNEMNYPRMSRYISYINLMTRAVKSIIGFERYALLSKFLLRYFRPENQVFLVRGLTREIGFKNENRKHTK